ncbi:MAG: TusE/DsrC/DsvC family sulfur relay protein [Gammaproteobacteria bacterium]|jgi:tRNA 2-thiouridine synthesizing protein E|nr:TusE/DsrC/DsvC family sulfur relay protein [Gammaproteobacteria bacterium]MBT5054011.1 TusE/DsrC/DsvC family sulfur relay protein [Gammaproteobacteria bacterium]
MTPRDREGFLVSPSDWKPEIADVIAEDLGIALSTQHWVIIDLLRRYYALYGLSPPSRVLMTLLKREHDPDFSSIALMQLFGGRARRQLAQIAGLPKPSDCD